MTKRDITELTDIDRLVLKTYIPEYKKEIPTEDKKHIKQSSRNYSERISSDYWLG